MPARTVNNLGGSAGRKRSRRDQDEDGGGQEVDEVRQASSGLQSDVVRISLTCWQLHKPIYLLSHQAISACREHR